MPGPPAPAGSTWLSLCTRGTPVDTFKATWLSLCTRGTPVDTHSNRMHEAHLWTHIQIACTRHTCGHTFKAHARGTPADTHSKRTHEAHLWTHIQSTRTRHTCGHTFKAHARGTMGCTLERGVPAFQEPQTGARHGAHREGHRVRVGCAPSARSVCMGEARGASMEHTKGAHGVNIESAR